MSDVVLAEIEQAIMTITLNRPETMNALDFEVVAGLKSALDAAAGEAAVKVVVLTGGPGRFCSGLNLKLVPTLSSRERRLFLEEVMALFRAILMGPKPVIAAVDGPALAGGFDLAVMCDIRYASERAVFGQPEIKVGFSQLIDPLWKIIGLGRARELALTGRTFGPDEALDMGLVSAVHPAGELLAATRDLARTLAGHDDVALNAARKMCREIPGLPVDQALSRQGEVFLELVGRPENETRIAAVLGGRKD